MELNVISSNILFDDPETGNKSWKSRRKLLRDNLLSFAPHIVGTQEGRRHQLEDFEELLNMKLISQNRIWLKNRMYPCIYFNDELFEVLDSGDFWLSETPQVAGSSSFDSSFPRLCTWAKFRAIKNEKDFYFFNTHLDHILGETRKAQALVLKEQISKIAPVNTPLVLTGDFNEKASGNVWSTLTIGLKLEDAWKIKDLDEQTSFHKFNGLEHDGCRIDWLLSRGFKINSAALDSTSYDGIYPSDHFPLKVSLDF